MIDNDLKDKDYIVVAACKDECFIALSEHSKEWFISMGSNEIKRLRRRDGFVFIGRLGKDTEANERRTYNKA